MSPETSATPVLPISAAAVRAAVTMSFTFATRG